MSKPVYPLPSLLHASATDAANMQMRKEGRSKWNRRDYNLAAETQERLTRACYTLPGDTDDKMCFIRSQIAWCWEGAGQIGLYSDWKHVMAEIERVLSAP